MLNSVFHKMVPKLKEVQEDVDKVEQDLEEDLVMTLSVMELKVVPKIIFLFSFSCLPQTSKNGILVPKLF